MCIRDRSSLVERGEGGSVEVRFSVSNRVALRSWVLGLLDHAEVVGPPELRAEIVAWLESIASAAPPVPGAAAARPVRVAAALPDEPAETDGADPRTVRDVRYRLRRLMAIVGWLAKVGAAPIDEVANIAPLPDLPSIVSEGAGQGLLTLACLQDLSQARSRWGAEADGFLSLFGTTVVLPGIADMATLDALSALSGDVELPSHTLGATQGARGRLLGSVSTSAVLRRRLPPDVIARGTAGAALALDGRRRMGWVRLTPAYHDSPWRELVAPGLSLIHI